MSMHPRVMPPVRTALSGKGAVARVSALLLAGALAGCNLAPDYQTPETPKDTAYKTDITGIASQGDWAPAAPGDAKARGDWWTVFADPQLNALEEKAALGNQTLRGAVARLDQARAAAGIARADYFPAVSGTASATRQQRSSNAAIVYSKTLYNDTAFSADFSWEIDLWGRVRNSVAAAKDATQASAADLASVELALRAELAGDYLTLAADDAKQVILDQTVVAYAKALELNTNRYKGGAAPAADVDQAQAQLAAARTQAEDMRLRRAQLEHAIAVLVGVPPAEFSLPARPLTGKPPAIQAGLPSTLLERRPDVAAAERRVASANAQVGVARAAQFPVLDLGAVAGMEANRVSKLFQAPAGVWSVGPTFTGPLFDAGKHGYAVDQARAYYDETVANYRQTVLTAYQDVEDQLTALSQLDHEAVSQEQAVAASIRALTQAQYRYTGGIATYLEVVTAQNTALSAQLNAADIHGRQMSAAVQLIKALGGGWQPDDIRQRIEQADAKAP